MRRTAVLVLVLAVIGVGGGLAWLRSGADTTTDVDVDAVAKAARASRGSTDADPGLRPEPGTYVWTGSGRDHVDALGGGTHEYGPRIVGVVTLGDGCEWTLEMTFAKERRLSRTYCTDEDGIHERKSVDRVSFFGIEDGDTSTCDDVLLVASDPAAPRRGSRTCRSSTRKIEHVHTASAPRTVTVDGEDVDGVVRVEDHGRVSGGSTGTTQLVTLFAPSGLPLEFEERSDVDSGSVVGDTTYTLDTHWKLESLTPR